MERSSQLSLDRFSSDGGCEVSSGDPFHHYVRENKDRMLYLVFRAAEPLLTTFLDARSTVDREKGRQWRRQSQHGDPRCKGNEVDQRGRRTGIRQS